MPEWQFVIALNEQLQQLQGAVARQQVTVRLIGQHLHANRVHYAHIEGDEFIVNQAYTDGVQPLAGRGSMARFGKAVCDACRRGETVSVADVRTDPRFTDTEREQLLAFETAAFIGTPLMKDGRWVAVFGVHSATPRAWTRAQIALVDVVAEKTWGAGERARAEEALGRNETRQAFLQRLNDTIRPLADPTRILQETCRLLGTHFRVNRVVYAEIEGDDCVIVHDYVDGASSMVGHLAWRNMVGSRTEEILTGWPLTVTDTKDESHTPEERAALEAAEIRAYLSPLLVKDGRFVGAFGIHSRTPRVWTADEIALAQEVADRTWAILEYRKAEAGLRASEGRIEAALKERTAELVHRTTQLSRMAWDLTLAEHHAREQIARTLHDGLQQLLVIVALNLDQELKRESECGITPSEMLVEAKQQIDEAIDVARSLNVELFPPVLHRSGLPAALMWLATWARDKYKLGVEITADPRADSTQKDVRTLLFESVRELLLNAVKYAKTERVTVSLRLDAADQLCVTVADQGAGFEPSILDARSTDRQLGWGLFRMRERLTLLGGRMDIDSAPGRGTRVRLVAPRAAQDAFANAHEPRHATPVATVPVNGTPGSPGALRILIVDDHPAVKHVLRDMLERPELAVVAEAANGVEAIVQAHATRPDLILMDITMPHMDGIEATTRIHRELPGITIFGLSTLARNEAADAMERAGASGFFVKGTDTQQMIERLMELHASRSAGVRAGP